MKIGNKCKFESHLISSVGYNQNRRGRGRGPRSPGVKEKVGSDFDFSNAQFEKKTLEEEFTEKLKLDGCKYKTKLFLLVERWPVNSEVIGASPTLCSTPKSVKNVPSQFSLNVNIDIICNLFLAIFSKVDCTCTLFFCYFALFMVILECLKLASELGRAVILSKISGFVLEWSNN